MGKRLRWRAQALRVAKRSQVRAAQTLAASEIGGLYSKVFSEEELRKKRRAARVKGHERGEEEDQGSEDKIASELSEKLPDFNKHGRHRDWLEDLGENADLLEEESSEGDSNLSEADQRVLQLAEKHYRDPTYRHAAILYAKRVLESRKDSSPVLIRRLEHIANADRKLNRSAIVAGENVMLTAHAYPQLGKGDFLAQFYRQAILGNHPPKETLDGIVQHFGEARLQEGSDFLIKALGQDLDAAESSADPIKLHSILDDLYTVEVLSNIHAFLRDDLEHMRENFREAMPLRAYRVLSTLLETATNTWMESGAFEQLADKANLKDNEQRIYFMNTLLEEARKIPEKFYTEDQQRELLLSSVQEALDKEIEQEA